MTSLDVHSSTSFVYDTNTSSLIKNFADGFFTLRSCGYEVRGTVGMDNISEGPQRFCKHSLCRTRRACAERAKLDRI